MSFASELDFGIVTTISERYAQLITESCRVRWLNCHRNGIKKNKLYELDTELVLIEDEL